MRENKEGQTKFLGYGSILEDARMVNTHSYVSINTYRFIKAVELIMLHQYCYYCIGSVLATNTTEQCKV